MKAHDSLVLWIAGEVPRWIEQFAPQAGWEAEDKAVWRRVHGDAPLPTWPGVTADTAEWEVPVYDGHMHRPRVIGSIDLRLVLRVPAIVDWREGPHGAGAGIRHREVRVHFEAKPKIDDLGGLFRQLRTYRDHRHGVYVVVSPDTKHAAVIESQGYAFVPAPGAQLSLVA